jgi:hypothetical protein
MYVVFFFKNVIEYFYIKYNQTSVIFKRDFNDLSYFEKLFLSFFYRKNIFNKSISNIYKNNNLLNFRQKNHPLVFFFHLYLDKMDYKFSNLSLIKKQFYFFSKSIVFSKTLNKFKFLFFKKNKNLSNVVIFLIIQKLFFKRYFNLCSSIYFSKINSYNLVKLNWIFYLFLENSKGFYKIYDLSKYSDWYDFNFKHINVLDRKILNKKNLLNKTQSTKKNFNSNKINYFYKIYNYYNKFFIKILSDLNLNYKNLILINFNFFKNSKIKLANSWLNSLKFFYPIRFSETSVSKHIKLNNISNYVFFYIRKNRIFNKGRYSRNRQLYRTGVYWCLWLNIMLVYGLYFMFYRFTFNFGYFWWGLLIFAYSTIFSRVLKYNFFNIFYLKNEFFHFLKWLGFIFLNIKSYILYVLKNIINIYILYLSKFFENTFISNLLYNNLINIKIFLFKKFKFKDSDKFIYFWESLPFKDESFFKYKSVIHWFTQLYKLLTY